MRRIVSALAGALLLTVSATATFAQEIATTAEGGIPMLLAQLDYRYQSTLISANHSSYVQNSGRRAEVYKFRGQSGQCVEMLLRSDDFDPIIGIYQRDTSGALIELMEDDDSSNGSGTRSARIRTTLSVGDAYYAVVSAAAPNQSGRYTLDLANCDSSGPSRSTSSPVTHF